MPQSLAKDLWTVTLYERLGGAAGIRRIVDGTVAAHMDNPLIGHRFQPYADRPERVEESKQHICDFFAAADDILKTMKALNYDAETRAEVGEIPDPLKPEITHV